MDVVPTCSRRSASRSPPDIGGLPLQRAVERVRRSRGRRSPRSATAASWPTACARRRDKYIRRFSPDDDELYFDLEKDPKEHDERARSRTRSACACSRPRPRPACRRTRSATSLRGRRRRAATRCTSRRGGWLEGVEATGLRPGRALDARRQRAAGSSSRPRRGPGPAARDRASPAARRRAGRARRHARRPPVARRPTCRSAARPCRPGPFPLRLPDIESETEADRGLDLFSRPRRPSRGCASGSPCRRAARCTSSTRRRASG